MNNNYTLILKELKKHGPEVMVDIQPLLLSMLDKPNNNGDIEWNLQRQKSFAVLYALKVNNHIHFDESKTLDRVVYNFRDKQNQSWIESLESFDAKITPLGISFLQQLSIDNINDSIIETNESVKKTNKAVKKSIPIQIGLSFLTMAIAGLTGYISYLTYQSVKTNEAQEKRLRSLEENLQKLKYTQYQDTTLKVKKVAGK